jgi:hypothetical protein
MTEKAPCFRYGTIPTNRDNFVPRRLSGLDWKWLTCGQNDANDPRCRHHINHIGAAHCFRSADA